MTFNVNIVLSVCQRRCRFSHGHFAISASSLVRRSNTMVTRRVTARVHSFVRATAYAGMVDGTLFASKNRKAGVLPPGREVACVRARWLSSRARRVAGSGEGVRCCYHLCGIEHGGQGERGTRLPHVCSFARA
jgi:hypothetical protein